jgi:hypothetical protein
MSRPRSGGTAAVVVRTGSALAGILSAHTVINAFLLRRPRIDTSPRSATRRVSVCIPARDEAARIGPTIASVVAQPSVDVHEVLVLDDGSTDGTAAVVLAAAGGDPRVRVIPGRDLAAGWLGKPHACQQLGEAATGEVLVFLDADVVLAPGAVRASVDLLEQLGVDLVSPYPRQIAVTGAERLVQPLLQWLWLTFLPLRLAERAGSPASMTAANGQLLAVRRAVWEGVGGHGAVRDAVVEDVWLARAVKRAGGRAIVADGTDLAHCRMYTSWPELRDGYTKSLVTGFGGDAASAATGALLTLAYLVPPAAAVVGAVTGRRDLCRVGWRGYLLAVLGRMVSARRTGGRVADSVAHPASVAALLALTVRSSRARAGGGTLWRGRRV